MPSGVLLYQRPLSRLRDSQSHPSVQMLLTVNPWNGCRDKWEAPGVCYSCIQTRWEAGIMKDTEKTGNETLLNKKEGEKGRRKSRRKKKERGSERKRGMKEERKEGATISETVICSKWSSHFSCLQAKNPNPAPTHPSLPSKGKLTSLRPSPRPWFPFSKRVLQMGKTYCLVRKTEDYLGQCQVWKEHNPPVPPSSLGLHDGSGKY